jgi:hypothetical protein
MATIEYQITVASKGDDDGYGSANAYYYDGKQSPCFQLYPGNTYKFMQEDASNDGHLLKLSLTSDGTHNSGSAYTTNVTHVGTPGNSGAYTQIVVVSTTPRSLYYYCHNHSGMGGIVEVEHDAPVVEDIPRTDTSVSLTVDNEGDLWSAARLLADIPTSDVSTSNDTITLTGHGYENNYEISYEANGGTVLEGLTDGDSYFIIKVDANTFKLSEASGGSAINLTGTGNNDQYISLNKVTGVTETTTTRADRDLAAATIMAAEIDAMDDGTFNWSWIKVDGYILEVMNIQYHDVDFPNNTITIPNHGFDAATYTNNLLEYKRPVGDTPISPVFNFISNCYAKVVDSNTIKLNLFIDLTIADPAITDSQTTETIEYNVTVAGRDGSYGGSGNAFYIDGVESPYLTFIRGNTYKFLQSDSSNDGHPLKLSTTSDGVHTGGGAEYTTGVTYVGTPGNSGAYTQYVVPSDAPNTLYYYCSNHSGMGSSITVNDHDVGYGEHSTFTLQRIRLGDDYDGSSQAYETPLNGSYNPDDATQGPYAPTAAEKQLYLNKYISHLTYLAGLSDWGGTDISVITAAVTKANNISF